jgi:uncharacterized iron-regulated membrane protein
MKPTPMTPNAAVAPRKNWLLAKSRQWHKWGGLLAGIFILIAGSSGILLNYKQPIFKALGLGQKSPKPDGERADKLGAPAPKLTTSAGFAAMPVTLERALELARAEWGEVQLERFELKEERGELTYKLKRKAGGELWINAATGSRLLKGEYDRMGKAGADGVPVRTTDWGKILLDLHTGKIGGEAGKAVMSLAALGLVFLTLSGVYLWAKPLLVRRQNARVQAVPLARIPAVVPSSSPSRSAERETVKAWSGSKIS